MMDLGLRADRREQYWWLNEVVGLCAHQLNEWDDVGGENETCKPSQRRGELTVRSEMMLAIMTGMT